MAIFPGSALCGGLAFIVLVTQYCPAQTTPVDAESDPIESAELDLMMRQASPELKLVLLDQFWKDYQSAGMIHWAYDEVCKAFDTSGQPAGALTAGEKLLARDPQDVEIAQKSLKIAEDQKDAALIGKWSAIAARTAGSSEAADARALRDHLDYQAYSDVLRIADTGRKREAIEQFLKSHKNSR